MYRKLLIGLFFILLSFNVNAVISQYNLSINASDFYYTSVATRLDNTTTLVVTYNNGFSPATIYSVYLDINTTLIPDTDVVAWANLTYYINTYTATKFQTKTYYYQIYNSSSGFYNTVYSGTFVAAGWYSNSLTALNLLNINKTSNTSFRFLVEDPGGTDYRTMALRAREYAPTGTYGAYMTISHAPPSSGYCHGLYTGGNWIVNTNTICGNETIPINGNMILNSNLTFENVTFDFNMSTNFMLVNKTSAFRAVNNSMWI
jgi:hypothetical protein